MTQPDVQTASPAAAPLLGADPREFRSNFNVRSFIFRHNMCGHPLFELPRLATLAAGMLDRGDTQHFVALGGKENTAVTKFTAMPQERRLAATVQELANSSMWLKISSADVADPEYAAFLQRCLQEIETLSGIPLRREISWSALTVFLASPHVVTPYHIDHESNFLFQVSGAKRVTLFDPTDRKLLPDAQIESFYSGNFQAAQYSEEFQARGTQYDLNPGLVVHNPPLGPHWVQNGSDVSVSVSIGFCMRSLDRRARIYQVNHYLRKAGLGPSPPGRSVLADRLKIAGIGLLSKSNPTTPDEILFSGLTRLSGPPRKVKRWISSLRGH
jgi:hypothetical protein